MLKNIIILSLRLFTIVIVMKLTELTFYLEYVSEN